MENFSCLLDKSASLLGDWISSFFQPWQCLPTLKDKLWELGKTLDVSQYNVIQDGVWVHKFANVSSACKILPPCIICEGAEIRHNAFLRGSVLVGKNCVVGGSVELKNCVLFDGAKVPHLSYCGDSILGKNAHLGAGAVLSNVRLDCKEIVVKAEKGPISTGLKKFGSIVGDGAQIGCNAVVNPGTIIHKNASVMPLASVAGEVKRRDER